MSEAKDIRLEEAVAEAVRETNRQGRAATGEDVLNALVGKGFDVSKQETPDFVGAILDSHAELASFTGADGGKMYHDPALLSATYARIIDRKGSPLLLMAEEIRTNSRDYPRPVPVEMFESPPFDLSREDIAQALQVMAASREFSDITFTTTSSGAVYLFSLSSLEREYARFLAEHAQNLAMNP